MTSRDSSDEHELIRRFQEGDEEAFRKLFERCEEHIQNRIEPLMSKALQRRLSVADVIQEARFIAFQQRETFEDRGPGSFRNWLLGIVELRARHLYRQHAGVAMRSIDQEVTKKFRPDTEKYPGKTPTPSQAAIGSELEDLARRAMADLSEEYREVLTLTRTENLSYEEAAERMGRSPGAVRKLRTRALLKFTEIFNRMRGEDHER